VAIHLCIGSVYAWSIFNPALMKILGVVAQAPGDWSLQQVTSVFIVAIAVLGLTTAFAGRWMEQVGPLAITALREAALQRAIENLARTIDPARFSATFGAPPTDLPALVAQKTVTIAKLMEIAPPGTINPSSTLYNSTMYLMAGLLGVALVANALLRPVDSKHYLPEDG
jgi:hypothetical protein